MQNKNEIATKDANKESEEDDLSAALDFIEKELANKGQKIEIERTPKIIDANGDVHTNFVDLKAEYDISSGLFKNIFLFKGVAQLSEIEEAKKGLCQATQFYRARANCTTATNLIIILRGKPADYSSEQIDAFKNTCCNYKFVDDILQKYANSKMSC